jgi:hypothetical protein
MPKRAKSSDPEIWCDFNGPMTEGYPTSGTVRDLTALGLTLEEAVGRHFALVSDDADEQGNPDDIMCNGTVVRDAHFGIEAGGSDFH